jgi:nucleoside-diphosphate-sugar epimerase
VRVEKGLGDLADDSFSPTYLRAATAYGYSPRLRGDVVVNNLVGSALTRGEVRLLSDGRSWRPLLHVEDMSLAFLAVLESPRASVHNEAFNVAPRGENYEIREVAELVAQEVPGCRVAFSEGAGPDPRSYKVDGGKLPDLVPDFQPVWTVPVGIQALFSALSKEDLSEAAFFGPRFMRLQRLRELLEGGELTHDLRWSPSHNTGSAFSDKTGGAVIAPPPG